MKIMTIRAPDNLRETIKQKARIKGLTVNALVLEILWQYLEKNKID